MRNNITRLMILLILIVLFISEISAATIENFYVKIEPIGSHVLISYEIKSDVETIVLNVPKDSEIIDISTDNYNFKEGTLIVSFNNSFKLDYITKSPIERTTKNYFTFDIKPSYDTKNLSIKMFLPEGAYAETVYPSPEITSDGRHIILIWNKALNVGESLPLFVIYKEKQPIQLILTILITSMIAIVIIITIIKLKKSKIAVRKEKKSKEKIKEIHLLESEKAVIEALKEGAEWQKQIQIKTGFSKAKISRLVRNLEARRLIKRIPIGNTNKIKLLIR